MNWVGGGRGMCFGVTVSVPSFLMVVAFGNEGNSFQIRTQEWSPQDGNIALVRTDVRACSPSVYREDHTGAHSEMMAPFKAGKETSQCN